jgi:hypothetical protein
MPTRAFRLDVLVLVAVLAAACGGGGGGGSDSPTSPAQAVPVQLVYLQATTVAPGIDFSQCGLEGGFVTHVHPGWASDPRNTRFVMTVAGAQRFELRVEVPPDTNTNVAVHDPNSCLTGSPYVAARELYANGVLLGSVAGSTNGDEMLFRVAPNGTVTLVTR